MKKSFLKVLLLKFNTEKNGIKNDGGGIYLQHRKKMKWEHFKEKSERKKMIHTMNDDAQKR